MTVSATEERHSHTGGKRQKIWIVNEYAMPPEYEARIRNNSMAKYLKAYGYDVTIIGGSELHGLGKNLMPNKRGYILREYEGQRFVHVGLPHYEGNGAFRTLVMVWFQWKLSLYARSLARQIGKPDVILYDDWAIPFCPAARLKRIFHAKLIKEVRDLWPESLVSFGYLRKESLLAKYLYWLEKRVYECSDAVVFSMEGGKEYLADREIHIKNVAHISNGVDMKLYLEYKSEYRVDDVDLDRSDRFKVIYSGSIRVANGLSILVDTACILKERGYDNIAIIVFGDGDQREQLMGAAKEMNLQNIIFKGRVEKKYVPYILSKASMLLLSYDACGTIWKYGQSNNKIFEYLAAGKPVLSVATTILGSDIELPYAIVRHYNAGIERSISSAEEYADSIVEIASLSPEKYQALCDNALEAAKEYDYKHLADKLHTVIGKL